MRADRPRYRSCEARDVYGVVQYRSRNRAAERSVMTSCASAAGMINPDCCFGSVKDDSISPEIFGRIGLRYQNASRFDPTARMALEGEQVPDWAFRLHPEQAHSTLHFGQSISGSILGIGCMAVFFAKRTRSALACSEEECISGERWPAQKFALFAFQGACTRRSRRHRECAEALFVAPGGHAWTNSVQKGSP